MDLRAAVETAVAEFHWHIADDDDVIHESLRSSGIESRLANRLIAFIPIAFTRFLLRDSGIGFEPRYVPLDAHGQPGVPRLIADEPIYQATIAHCEDAAREGAARDYFEPIAARSGGFKSIQELLRQMPGMRMEEVRTGPPVIWD